MNTEEPARWIGPDPSALIELHSKLERFQGYAAVTLADAVADGLEGYQIEWRLQDYERARAEARRVTAVYRACYGAHSPGRWAGYLVRDGGAL